MDPREDLVSKRLAELASLSYTRGIPLFSSFLTEGEQERGSCALHHPGICAAFWGGYPDAERKCAVFLPEDVPAEELENRIDFTFWDHFACLRIAPSSGRFSRELSHRDYLGALLGLGISREKLGDMTVRDNVCRLICDPAIAAFLCAELAQVGPEGVRAELEPFSPEGWAPETEPIAGTVASNRLDAIVGLLCRVSREKAAELIRTERVQVGGQAVTQVSASVPEGRRLSVRGFGKFRIDHIGEETRKGRLRIAASRYV